MEELTPPVRHGTGASEGEPHRAHHRPGAGSGNPAHGDPELFENREDPHMRQPPCSTATERQDDPTPIVRGMAEEVDQAHALILARPDRRGSGI